MECGPIFIGGLAGSGKTRLRLSLSSHPNIALSRRTYMWTRFYKQYGDLSQPDKFERCLAAMLRHKPMQFLNPDPDRIRREFWQGEPTYARLFALFHQHYAEGLGKPRWGDQLGLVERYADPIFAAYPAAKMIHMIRDPRDQYEGSVNSSQPRRGQVGRNTARWLYSVGLANRNQRRYPDRYMVVRYETLVTQREETLRDICAFINEVFVPAMLSLEGAVRFGDKNDQDIDDEPDVVATATTSSQRLRQLMTKRELAFMQAYAGREMAAHNYSLEPVQYAFRDRLLYSFVDWPANLASLVAWRTLQAKQPAR